jgi:sarcosine/dimethylglycine N-methyltransferase
MLSLPIGCLPVASPRDQRGHLHSISGVGLAHVQAEYSEGEGDISHLIMGELVHVGGLHSTLALASRARIEPGSSGVDLCCYTGGGMRVLVRFCSVGRMVGVDATEKVVEHGREICHREEFDERISFVLGDACATGLATGGADFVWGEDAWCYVEDKEALILEAARLVRPGGTIAFTDWVEGAAGLSSSEAERLLRHMRFPSIMAVSDYQALLGDAGFSVEVAEDTGRFAPHFRLYRDIVTMQMTYDALRAVAFDGERMEALEREREFIARIAEEGKLIQAMFVARRS